MSVPGPRLHTVPTHLDDPVNLAAELTSDLAGERVSRGEQAARREIDRARQDLPRLEPVVWDCYLGELTEQMRRTSEADPIGIYVSLLGAAGVRLGQHPRVQAGDDRHPLLVWPMVIGRSGGGRKGASWSAARRLLSAADPGFAAGNVRSGLTSGEGLAAIFAEPEEHHTEPEQPETGLFAAPPKRGKGSTGGLLPPGDRRLLVFEPEWAAVMARMRREGNTLSATLRAAWEGGDLSTLNVTARVAPTSHVGLIVHITPEEFRAKLSTSDLAGGTYNRFLPISVARAQFLPLSTGAPAELVERLGATLAHRLTDGASTGAIGFTGPAATVWRDLYVEFGTDHGDTGPVEQFLARTAPNCLRIAGIHAALDGRKALEPRHLQAAAALVRYSIDSVRAVFSTSDDQRKLLAYLADAGAEGRTKTEITNVCFGKNKDTKTEIEPLLAHLLAAGTVTKDSRAPAGGRGRRAEVYLAVLGAGLNGRTEQRPDQGKPP